MKTNIGRGRRFFHVSAKLAGLARGLSFRKGQSYVFYVQAGVGRQTITGSRPNRWQYWASWSL